MNRWLQIAALVLGVAAVILWAALGANRGWTRTTVPVRTIDEVTGIEGITYQFPRGLAAGSRSPGRGRFALSQTTTKTSQLKGIITMKRSFLTLIALAGLGGALYAEPLSFDFKDPKGVNNVVFKLDAPLEAIQGSASGISGTVSFDPANPAATKGRLVVSAASLHVPNPMMKEHLHGPQWMEVAKHPEITFEAAELRNVKTSGDNTTGEVSGSLTIKGVTKEITAPVKLTYLRDKLGQRVPNLKGDLLVIRSTFTVKRSDFGINPGAPQDKVADEIELSLSVAGAAPRQGLTSSR
jgi:polyisoprenoid-binding protein YceI